MPDGSRQGFTFQPYQEAQDLGILTGLITYYHPYFIPDPGNTYTLSVPDALLTKDGNEYDSIEDSGLDSYNPQDPTYGNTYTLTDPQGLKYTINATTGMLETESDRHNNTLTFTANGIFSNRGPEVTFQRDVNGNIIKITDPNGNSLLYGYDANGDLTSVTDRLGNVTTLVYRTDVAHYLSRAKF